MRTLLLLPLLTTWACNNIKAAGPDPDVEDADTDNSTAPDNPTATAITSHTTGALASVEPSPERS